MKEEKVIKDLIKKGESEQVEFCENLNEELVAKTVSSFLNAEGGQLLLGIKNNGDIKGIKDANQTKENLRKYLLNNIVPEAPVTISLEVIDDKEILMAEVWGGSKKPYIFSGSIYYRRGDKTVQATSKEISELIHSRQQSEVHWERQPILGAEFNDLDETEIKHTIRQLQDSGRGKEMSDNVLEFLSYYGLYQDGYLTNAAMVLFGKEPTRFIPQCRVRFAILSKGKTGSSFSEDQYLEASLFKNAEGIYELLKKNLAFNSSFDNTLWQRTEGFLYPMAALREGVMNALVHRDYSNPAGTISILVYPDRLEISNYGKLPVEIRLTDLKRNHISLPNNPDIAHVCFLKGYIDKIGRGTLKIIEACKSAGIKAPVWSAESNTIKLTFYNKAKKPVATEGVSKGVIEDVTEGINKGVIAKIEGVTEAVIEGVTADVRDKIRKILLVLLKYEGIRANDIGGKIGVPVKSIERYIKQLKEAGLIEYKGAPKTGGYFLTKKARG
jgi:ATP-dependent DNA helicase RecG